MLLLVTLLTLLHSATVLVDADYIVTVNIISYANLGGRCASCPPREFQGNQVPGCCDDLTSNDCMGVDQCDTKFLYCLRTVQTPRMMSGGDSNCSPVHPPTETMVAMDSNAVDFNGNMVLGLSNPFNLIGISREYMAGLQLYIWVIDEDEDGVEETIDEFIISIATAVNDTNTLAGNRRETGVNGIARMELSYTVRCARYYYGTNCEIFNACEFNDVNCTTGQGRCVNINNGESSRCECNAGFAGDLCEGIDHCGINGVNCSGNGECVNRQNGNGRTFCVCNEGFMGSTCGQRVGEVSVGVIIAASVGGSLVLILGAILGVILICFCYRKAPRPEPKTAHIERRQKRASIADSAYSQFRWSRFDPTQAPPMSGPTAYQHTASINKAIPGYEPVSGNFTTKTPPTEPAHKASSGAASAKKKAAESRKPIEEQKMIKEESEEEEAESSTSEEERESEKEEEQRQEEVSSQSESDEDDDDQLGRSEI